MTELIAKLVSALPERKVRPGFRYDIAGLRAIAVLMVTLCHFGIPGFTGGFIGPDIFFVLSGYLITGILFREFSESKPEEFAPGRISMSNFYLKRVRRIFPAAFFVLLAINVYAHFNLNVLQNEQLKSDSIWTVFFAANITFMHQATDYFAQTLTASPLQHYWSLAVEEQFYLIWPMFFLFAANMRRLMIAGRHFAWTQRLYIFFGVAIAGSAFWLVDEFSKTPSSAYFSTFGRIWELALGGILSLVDVSVVQTRLKRAYLSLRIFALATVILSLVIVTPTNFGHTLFIPAIATGFLLVTGAGQQTPDLVNRILSIRLLTAIGAISYSLYLWHWPLVVFGKPLGYFQTLPEQVLGVFVAIAFATASYWLIEKPALKVPLPQLKRFKERTAMRPHVQQSAWRTGSIALTLVAVLTFVLYPMSNTQVQDWTPPASAGQFAPNPTDTSAAGSGGTGQASQSEKTWQVLVAKSLTLAGLPKDLSPSITDVSAIAKTGGFGACVGKRFDAKTFSQVCESQPIATTGTHTAVVLGDSHARMLWPAIIGALDPQKWHVILLAMPGCPVPVLTPNHLNSQNGQCAAHREQTLKYVERIKPELTILSDGVDSTPKAGDYLQAYLPVMARVTAASKYVVLAENSPSFPNLINCLDAQNSLAKCQPKQYKVDPLRAVQRQIVTRYQLGYWNLSQALCAPSNNAVLCPAVIGKTPTSADGAHLIPAISQEIAPFLARILDNQGIPDVIAPLN